MGCILKALSEAEDMCIDPASAATITRVLAYSARTFPLDCNVYLEWLSLYDFQTLFLRLVDAWPSASVLDARCAHALQSAPAQQARSSRLAAGA